MDYVYTVTTTDCTYMPYVLMPTPIGQVHVIIDNFPEEEYEPEDE